MARSRLAIPVACAAMFGAAFGAGSLTRAEKNESPPPRAATVGRTVAKPASAPLPAAPRLATAAGLPALRQPPPPKPAPAQTTSAPAAPAPAAAPRSAPAPAPQPQADAAPPPASQPEPAPPASRPAPRPSQPSQPAEPTSSDTEFFDGG